MDAIFSWAPLIWAARIVALLVTGGASIIVLALLIRLLNPSNLKWLASGGLPSVRKGRFTFMGQELDISTVAESERDDQNAALHNRVDSMAEELDELAMLVRSLFVERSRRRDE